MDKKEEMLREAVQKEYLCNGKYACSERDYCRFCEGKNTAHDCDYECYADEFAKGFDAGWDACLKHLSTMTREKAINEIKNYCKRKED